MPTIPKKQRATQAVELRGHWSDIIDRKPAVTVTGQYVVIRTEYHRKGGDDYPIALARIDTPTALVGWVHHLLGKGWFDAWTARELIEKVSEHFGWNYEAD